MHESASKTTPRSTRDAAPSASGPCQVAIELFLDPEAPRAPVVILVKDPIYRGSEPGDLQLDLGSWRLEFTITNQGGADFADGPILFGLGAPSQEGNEPVAFRFTRSSPSTIAVEFELTKDSGATFRYAIRLKDDSGTIFVNDPKVINRGYPTTPQTPPLEY